MEPAEERLRELLHQPAPQSGPPDTPAIIPTPPRSRPRGRWTWVVAAVAVAAAVVGLVAAVLHGPSGAHRSQPAADASASTQPASYRRLSVQVPAAWRLQALRCGNPAANTVAWVTVGAMPACGGPWAPHVTAVVFDPRTGYPQPLTDPRRIATSVDGHPATRVRGRFDGEWAVRYVVPDAVATATFVAPSLARARQLAATLRVTTVDPHGCASRTRAEPLDALPAPSRPDAESAVIPGSPDAVSVCSYSARGWLDSSGTLTGNALAGFVRTVDDARPGTSVVDPTTFLPNCTGAPNGADSLDRGADAAWFVLRAHYATGPALVLRARTNLCGHLGISNGARSGQDSLALYNALVGAVPASAAFVSGALSPAPGRR